MPELTAEYLTAEYLTQLLNLEPHIEGGRYMQTYRSSLSLKLEGYEGQRAASTAIYYLFTPEGHSRMHRVKTDEIFHFYGGDPLEMLLLLPDGKTEILELSANFSDGGRPQRVIPAGVWQGTRLKAGGKWALIGATVAPGFEFEDYEEGSRADLLESYPLERERIVALTLE
jgi:uncharacterized protein